MNDSKTAPIPPAARTLPRIAYLTSQYPTVSHTFILREVETLRRLGAEVLTCSIRRTPPAQHRGPAERDAAATTFNVLQSLRSPRRVLAAQARYLRRPGRYSATLALALRTSGPGLRAWLYQWIYFLEAVMLADHLESERVTHLHNHFTSGCGTVAMLASELSGIPFSLTLHGPADLEEPRRWRLDEKVARARFVAAISHFARSQLMLRSDPTHWPKIRIVHCGVAPARYEAEAGDPIPERRDGEIRLLFVGRLAPVKGLRILLEAMGHLMVSLPDLHLVIVGDGPDRAALEAAAAPLGAAVSFTGYLSQDEVASAMQSCDIFVLPSFAEGVPVVLMEALASCRPVIATQVAGVGELVEDGKSGFIVPPGDAATLADRIGRLAADPELRDRMGRHGQAVVRAEFDIETEAARLARLLVDVPGTGSAPRPEPLSIASDG
ncbi:glycosyltransferase family 4 protein [Tropicimonas sp. IMCC6043]|uniref:glycosyltransferase family 4 protein n=1 Tax=Tropicimonas sp. IMCC6043 TaxID=2510645 RepID=UPI00101D2EF1|nr:glycosyltransferase family 4 protein [Tropicimonas sp. IMCC6043]RYH07648.1 colanic acid biosynthesis glycosyltransferase WcaL [Tropicimonas sp. IMCC6043]